MALSIKNDEAEALARKLAATTGESLTDAVRLALAERYERVRRRRSMAEDLMEIGKRCASRPVTSNMTEDEILGYDEFGIPTK